MNHCRDPRVLVSLATTLFIFQAILPGATPQAANRSTADIVTAIAEDGNDLNAEKVIFFWALLQVGRPRGKLMLPSESGLGSCYRVLAGGACCPGKVFVAYRVCWIAECATKSIDLWSAKIESHSAGIVDAPDNAQVVSVRGPYRAGWCCFLVYVLRDTPFGRFHVQ